MVNAVDIKEVIESASIRGNFIREKFDSRNIPDNLQKIIVIPIFPELSHLLVFANYIFPSLKNDINFKDKYIIIVTWKGFSKFFAQADEVWSQKSVDNIDRFYEKTEGMLNKSDTITVIFRSLNEFFRNVIDPSRFANLFQNGFNRSNIGKNSIDIVKSNLPNINYLNQSIVKSISELGERKVFIIPFKFIKQWHLGKVILHKLSSSFYQSVIESFTSKNIKCVVLKNYMTFDISKDFIDNPNVLFVQEDDWFLVMAYILSTKIFVDFFSGLNSMSMYCGCRSISIAERNFNVVSNQKDIELCMTDSNIDTKVFTFFDLNYSLLNKKLFFIDKLIYEIVNTNLDKHIENKNKYSVDLQASIVERVKQFHPKFIGIKKKVIEE